MTSTLGESQFQREVAGADGGEDVALTCAVPRLFEAAAVAHAGTEGERGGGDDTDCQPCQDEDHDGPNRRKGIVQNVVGTSHRVAN